LKRLDPPQKHRESLLIPILRGLAWMRLEVAFLSVMDSVGRRRRERQLELLLI